MKKPQCKDTGVKPFCQALLSSPLQTIFVKSEASFRQKVLESSKLNTKASNSAKINTFTIPNQRERRSFRSL